jgi:hypothetical protein
MKNKSSLRRIKRAVRRGSIAAMQRAKEKENAFQEAAQKQNNVRIVIVRG